MQQNLQKIRLVEEKLVNQPDSLRLNSWLNRLLNQREKLLLFNQKYWGNLRRKEWITCGDQNSKFFQQRAINRQKQKLVHKLKNNYGIWMDLQSEIAGKFISNYKQQFKAVHNSSRNLAGMNIPTCISHSDNQTLIKIPNISEIKEALFSIDVNKTPRLDGFGVGFFQHYWEHIKVDFCQCITKFFRSGKLLKQINHTFITLTPK